MRARVVQCLMVLFLLKFSKSGFSADRCPQLASTAKPVRLLIVIGGHPYEPSEFFRAFGALPNVHYDHVLMMDAQPVAVPVGGLQSYDVVLFYDMEANAITPEWRSLLDRGKGLVFLHHAVGSFPDSTEYKKIVGGHGNFFPDQRPGVPSSGAHLNERQHLSIVDPAHPVTCGIKDFELVDDEPYSNVDVDPTVHALVKSDYPQGMPIVAWTWTYEKKRVFYMQMGHGSLGLPTDHGPTAYENASFQRLLDRGILWAAGRL